jgi:hypothetical protein
MRGVLKNAVNKRQDRSDEPPLLIKGRVTPVNGSISRVPKTLRVVCIRSKTDVATVVML